MTGRVVCMGNDQPFEGKMQRLVATLEEQFMESTRLQTRITETVVRLGLGT